MQSSEPSHCRPRRPGHRRGPRRQIWHGPLRHATTTRNWRSTLKHLARSLVVLLIVTCAWRYVRESVGAWLAHATRAPLAPEASTTRLPSGEHYSPGEDLERLDYEAVRAARHSLDIAMYSFTYVLLAEAVREAGRRGVRVRRLGDCRSRDLPPYGARVSRRDCMVGALPEFRSSIGVATILDALDRRVGQHSGPFRGRRW